MRLHQPLGPNLRVVTMLFAEKGIELDRVCVDTMRGESRQEPCLSRNPYGHTPIPELEDGRCLAEGIAICEYLEERHPEPALIGCNARERAETRMTVRRIDQEIVVSMTTAFRGSEGYGLFKDRLFCVPDSAANLERLGEHGLAKPDRTVAGNQWLSGDRFTLADILLFAFLDFGEAVGQPPDPVNANLAAWFERVKARPSAAISANPKHGLKEPA
jgi:glutathione S-transferase